ncbi:MAG TPA: TonB family protein [Pyrinomonadaceae bacterium]
MRPSRARALLLAVSATLVLTSFLQAQSPQLSLADLLIGLRSKKVTLQERNTILTEAVRQRGVTFVISPEIEKELETTGASPTLIEAIRQKSAPKHVPAPVVAKATPTPIPSPTPPDFSFYQTRADQNAGKGEFTLALADYTKSLEMKSDNAAAYLNRGKTHYNLRSYDLSVKDFDKALELNPKDSVAFLNRGISHEKLGDANKAMVDFQKAVDLDPSNEVAKANLKRLQDAQAAAAAAEALRNTPPEFVSLGTLTGANATKMVTPTYSIVAQRANIEGRVSVEVELDTEGEVVSAKATSGHQMLRGMAEDAARRSRFKPATYNNRPIKAKGVIIYNFTLKPTR